MSSASTPNSISSSIYSGTNTPRQIDHFESPIHEFSTPPAGGMASTEELLCCKACGTQFDVENRSLLRSCRICDDPRQFVPRTGQAFTTLGELRRTGYKNKWEMLDGDDRFWSIWTEPKFAIGQRAILIRTPHGNILWDCITLIDGETVEWINSLGGLGAIVISHPHYYTTVSACCYFSYCLQFCILLALETMSYGNLLLNCTFKLECEKTEMRYTYPTLCRACVFGASVEKKKGDETKFSPHCLPLNSA